MKCQPVPDVRRDENAPRALPFNVFPNILLFVSKFQSKTIKSDVIPSISSVSQSIMLRLDLKRFSETRWSKLSNTVEFPTNERELNMAPYAANSSASATYSLYGISNHMGKL